MATVSLRIALAAGCLAALALAAPTSAAFPGANGKIAFETNRDGNYEIYTINADGTNQTNITNSPAFDTSSAWSPDGTKIAFATGRDSGLEIYTMNADGTNPTRLTSNTAGNAWPAWSPDGAKIAFATSRDGNEEIYTMNADGTNPTRLTNNPAADTQPAWSPDGTKIAFFTDRDPGDESHIYTMNADGSNQTRLTTDPALDSEPAWSPDGTKIAFTTNRDGNDEIYTIDADGSNQMRLTNNTAFDVDPAWSPDGAKIAFVSDRGGNHEIYTMDADGTDETRITNNPAYDALPDWQPIPVSYARPRGATPTQVSLVPAYSQCTAPNRTHGAPLSFGSCAPPAQTSSQLTTGTPDANGQPVKMYTKIVYAARSGDLAIQATITDIRNKSDLSDYPGQLRVVSDLRITDKNNTPNPGGPGPGTVQDVPLPFDISCSPTADTTVGSACNVSTTVNALFPGAITAGQRSIWQLGPVRAYDGGPDGIAATEGDNTLFVDQGLFIP